MLSGRIQALGNMAASFLDHYDSSMGGCAFFQGEFPRVDQCIERLTIVLPGHRDVTEKLDLIIRTASVPTARLAHGAS